MPNILTEGMHNAEFMVSEASGHRSRGAAIVAATGAALIAGTILGQITAGDVTAAAAGGNTGNGTLTPDATDATLAGAQVGDYSVVCIAADTDAGTFRVSDPAGNVLGDVEVGDTWANQIKFVIADGATDFAAGDEFTVTVADGSGNYVRHDPTATDGSEIAAAILWEAVDEDDVVSRTVIVRDAEVVGAHLTYSASATDAQKATARAQLAERGIITR
jgi:hypothetical protein